MSKIKGPVGSWLDLEVKRTVNGRTVLIHNARLIREVKFLVDSDTDAQPLAGGKAAGGALPSSGMLLAAALPLLLLAFLLALSFFTTQGCVHTGCKAWVSYVGPAASLYPKRDPSKVVGARYLGSFDAAWQCEEACVLLPSGGSALVEEGRCVAFTYVAHSSAKEGTWLSLNGECYGRITDRETDLEITEQPFLRPSFQGAPGIEGVVSGRVRMTSHISVFLHKLLFVYAKDKEASAASLSGARARMAASFKKIRRGLFRY